MGYIVLWPLTLNKIPPLLCHFASKRPNCCSCQFPLSKPKIECVRNLLHRGQSGYRPYCLWSQFHSFYPRYCSLDGKSPERPLDPFFFQTCKPRKRWSCSSLTRALLLMGPVELPPPMLVSARCNQGIVCIHPFVPMVILFKISAATSLAISVVWAKQGTLWVFAPAVWCG